MAFLSILSRVPRGKVVELVEKLHDLKDVRDQLNDDHDSLPGSSLSPNQSFSLARSRSSARLLCPEDAEDILGSRSPAPLSRNLSYNNLAQEPCPDTPKWTPEQLQEIVESIHNKVLHKAKTVPTIRRVASQSTLSPVIEGQVDQCRSPRHPTFTTDDIDDNDRTITIRIS